MHVITHCPPGKQAVRKVLGQHMGETPSLDVGRQGRLPGRGGPLRTTRGCVGKKEGLLCQCEHSQRTDTVVATMATLSER